MEKEIFGKSGPVHLTCVDWKNLEHRRSVAACLVRAVSILEIDKQQNRTGRNAQGPNWWNFFHFQCIKNLVDPVDSSIFGAIFEYKKQNQNYFNPKATPQSVPPRYVIAFRGTLMKLDTIERDIYLDLRLMINQSPRNSRYVTAFQAVQDIIAQTGPKNVWLAGHSLGAAIALQAGKDMAKRGCHIETYLFNPPFTSIPIEKLVNDPYLKGGIRIGRSILRASLSVAVNFISETTEQQQYDPFTVLCSWIPYIFVNPNDTISNGYIEYFEHRERMEAWGVGWIERVATKSSITSLISGALGREGEATHLIPSAFLTKNMISTTTFRLAHGVQQWWNPHLYCQSKLYQFRS